MDEIQWNQAPRYGATEGIDIMNSHDNDLLEDRLSIVDQIARAIGGPFLQLPADSLRDLAAMVNNVGDDDQWYGKAMDTIDNAHRARLISHDEMSRFADMIENGDQASFDTTGVATQQHLEEFIETRLMPQD